MAKKLTVKRCRNGTNYAECHNGIPCKIQLHKQEYQNQYDLSIAAFKPLKKAIAYSTATKL